MLARSTVRVVIGGSHSAPADQAITAERCRRSDMTASHAHPTSTAIQIPRTGALRDRHATEESQQDGKAAKKREARERRRVSARHGPRREEAADGEER